MDSPGVERNRLLALLDAETRARLEPALEVEPLHARQIVMRPDVPLRRGYFPLDGAFSLIALDASGSGVEVGSIGYEGLLGLPIILGTITMPLQGIVQLPGSAASLPAEVMRAEHERGESFHQVVDRYVAALLFQTSQSVACNRLHDLQQRAARWLLTMDDRYHSDAMPLTHEFLAMMLGTSRPKVSASLGALGRQDIIQTGRGSVCIVDRPGLQDAACECYGLIQAEFDRLLGTPAG
jgi:CRP-like cAMP-binding protein